MQSSSSTGILEEDNVKMGYTMRLNELLQKCGKTSIKWKESRLPGLRAHSPSPSPSPAATSSDPNDGNGTGKVEMWKAEAWLGDKLLGTGTAISKTKARNAAAKYALEALEEEFTPAHDRAN